MKTESVLVTGAHGFIGSNLYRELETHQPFELWGVDDEIFSVDNWADKFLKKLEELNPSVIFHVGACSDTLETNANFMFERNYFATQIILDWGRAHGTKVIYSSSAANYGTNGIYPSNLYGWSKYVSEKYAQLVGAVSLRYFNVYGPGEEAKGKMASVFLQAYLLNSNNKEIKLFPGTPVRDFVYIRDVVSANLFAYRNFDLVSGGVYEVASGKSESFEYGMSLMAFPYTYFQESDIPDGYQFETCADFKEFMPGWLPKYDLESGLEDYKKYLGRDSIG